MAEAGKFNRLMVTKLVDIGAYLDGDNLGRILLPQREVPANCLVGGMVDVFLAYDQESRFIASTRRPLALPGEFAYLKVVKVSSLGAWLDWGLTPALLAPIKEQRQIMEEGKSYLVRVLHEEKWHRIVASSRVDEFLDQSPVDYRPGQPVNLLIGPQTDLGYKAIVNNAHWGVLYANEVFRPLKKGERCPGCIKKIRDDHKIDLSLQMPGYDKMTAVSEQVLDILRGHGGYLSVSDKTPPEQIYQLFGMSKKNFKKALGALYKRHRISLEEQGIRLNKF